MIANCPYCNFKHNVSLEDTAKSFTCKNCGKTFKLDPNIFTFETVSLVKNDKASANKTEKVLCTRCPHCLQFYSIDETQLGKFGICKVCKKEFHLNTSVKISANDYSILPADQMELYNSISDLVEIYKTKKTPPIEILSPPPSPYPLINYPDSKEPKNKYTFSKPKKYILGFLIAILIIVGGKAFFDYFFQRSVQRTNTSPNIQEDNSANAQEDNPASAQENNSSTSPQNYSANNEVPANQIPESNQNIDYSEYNYIKIGSLLAVSEMAFNKAKTCNYLKNKNCLVDQFVNGNIFFSKKRRKIYQKIISDTGIVKIQLDGEDRYLYTSIDSLEK